jgi:hypothetical protein
LLGSQKVFIVLDALDESATRPELFTYIREMADMPGLAHTQLLCTGRPEKEFSRDIPSLIGEDNCIGLDKEAINAEILSYATQRLQQSQAFIKWAAFPNVLEKIRTTIERKSDGM